MSYDQIDRLPDDFWTDSELDLMSELIINPSRIDDRPKHICWYHLVKDGVYTGKAMLLAVESIVDGQEAVNRALADVDLTAVIGDYGDTSALNGVKAESLYMVLNKYAYKGTVSFNGDDKVFSYEEWMAKLC